MTKNNDVEELKRLERLIAKGIQAYDQRNALIVALVARRRNGGRIEPVARRLLS